MSPRNSSRTDSGKFRVSPLAITSAGVRLLLTMNRAMSPTTLLLGVTFTMSPNMVFTSENRSFTSSNLSSKPSEAACGRRLEYCPPGISC